MADDTGSSSSTTAREGVARARLLIRNASSAIDRIDFLRGSPSEPLARLGQRRNDESTLTVGGTARCINASFGFVTLSYSRGSRERATTPR
jgi:hypothetical protein